jgi:hypothetical protein
MMNQYHFITRWRVQATAEEVFEILSQSVEYPRWWPSVYLMVRELAAGNRDGEGKHIRLLTKGWLPYKLRWEASTVGSRRPNRIAIRAVGDFEGRGIWSIVEDGEFTDITFDWKLVAAKPLLRWLSPLLRPVFEANHRWAMEQGRKSLELEIARSRAQTVEEMNAISPPAPAANVWSAGLIAGTVLAAGLVLAFVEGGNSSPRAAACPDPQPCPAADTQLQ